MKNLKYLNEERRAKRNTTEKKSTRGCPHLENLYTMRNTTSRSLTWTSLCTLMKSSELVKAFRESKHVKSVITVLSKDKMSRAKVGHREEA